LLIELTIPCGNETESLWINPNHIVALKEGFRGGTLIYTTQYEHHRSGEFCVLEPLNKVVDRIQTYAG